MKIQYQGLTLEADTIEQIEVLWDFVSESGIYDEKARAVRTGDSEEDDLADRYREIVGKNFRMTNAHKDAGLSRLEALKQWFAENSEGEQKEGGGSFVPPTQL